MSNKSDWLPKTINCNWVCFIYCLKMILMFNQGIPFFGLKVELFSIALLIKYLLLRVPTSVDVFRRCLSDYGELCVSAGVAFVSVTSPLAASTCFIRLTVSLSVLIKLHQKNL